MGKLSKVKIRLNSALFVFYNQRNRELFASFSECACLHCEVGLENVSLRFTT